MEQFKDYYAILEISRFATNTQIRAAYLKRCKECHPDKNLGTDTTKIMQDVNEAKSVLLDPVKRANFDYHYNSFKNDGNKQQQQKHTNPNSDFEKQQRTVRNRQRYEELKRRIITFKEKEQYLYNTYLDQIKKKSTQEILNSCDNWTEFSVEFIDMSINELHESRKYGLDFIYSRIKETTVNAAPVTSDPKNEKWPWWATWLIFGLVNALIKAAATK